MSEMSLLGFIGALQGAHERQERAIGHALERAARVVEREAKASIGTYQDQAGPFVQWAELADFTKDDRVAQGFSENDPGLRTGAMRDSISHTVTHHEAVIGSDDDHLVWFELGTVKQPPRSVLGGALVRKAPDVVAICGQTAVGSLIEGGATLLPISLP